VGSFGACRTLTVIPRSRQQLLTLIAIALTFASGANDVFAFTRLGGVFTSVMTGNIVFFGLAVAERSVSLASHTAVSIGGYMIGVAVATWVSHGVKKRSASGQASVLPRHVSWALAAELVLLAGGAVGWEITGARARGWAEFVLLAVAAAAMGVQSAAVNEMGFSNFSTTFLTGTLTWLVSSVTRPGGGRLGRPAQAQRADRAGGRGVPERAAGGGRGAVRSGAGAGRGGDRAGAVDAGGPRGLNVTGWCQHVDVRPALKAGLLPVWRDRDTLQFGVDPRRAVAVAGLGQTAAVLALLDGSRDRRAGDRGGARVRGCRPRRRSGCWRCWRRPGCSTTSRPGRTPRSRRRCGPGWRRSWLPRRWPTRRGTAGRARWPGGGPPTSASTARAGPGRAWPASWPPPASGTSAAPTRRRPSLPTSRPPGSSWLISARPARKGRPGRSRGRRRRFRRWTTELPRTW